MKCCCFWNKDKNNININPIIKSSNSQKILDIQNENGVNIFNISKNYEIKNIMSYRTTSRNPVKIKEINNYEKSIIKEETEYDKNKNNFPKYSHSSVDITKNHSHVKNLKFNYFDDDNIKDNIDKLKMCNSNIQSIPILKIPKKGSNLKFSEKKNLSSNKKKTVRIYDKNNNTSNSIKLSKCKTHIFGEKNNIKFTKLNVPHHRGSVINYESKRLSKEISKKKSASLVNIRNKNLHEYNIIKIISKINHFSTRENLINLTKVKNLKNLKSFIKNGKDKHSSHLILENYDGKLLFQTLIIGPFGLFKYSRRKVKDTLTFFGYSEYKDYNDYVFNNTSFIYNNKLLTKTFFAISYDINYNIYFIQPILDKNKDGRFILNDISNSNFPFINHKVFMINKSIFQIIPFNEKTYGPISYFLRIKLIQNDNDSEKEILINVLKYGKPIKIGYDKESFIQLQNENEVCIDLYCNIIFDKDKEIYSIYGKGIWYVLDQKFAIKKETFVKIGDEIIEINVSSKNIYNNDKNVL